MEQEGLEFIKSSEEAPKTQDIVTSATSLKEELIKSENIEQATVELGTATIVSQADQIKELCKMVDSLKLKNVEIAKQLIAERNN